MSPPRPVGRLHRLQGWTLEVVFSTGSELLFDLGNIGSLGLLLSPTPFAEDCEVHRPCLGLRSSQRQTLKCLGEHTLWTGEDVLPVRMILFHLRGPLATRYRVKMQLVTQYLPCDSKDQVYRKRSVSVGGASLSSQASSGWSPEKGCSLRNKEEGGEGLSRPLRAYPHLTLFARLVAPSWTSIYSPRPAEAHSRRSRTPRQQSSKLQYPKSLDGEGREFSGGGTQKLNFPNGTQEGAGPN